MAETKGTKAKKPAGTARPPRPPAGLTARQRAAYDQISPGAKRLLPAVKRLVDRYGVGPVRQALDDLGD